MSSSETMKITAAKKKVTDLDISKVIQYCKTYFREVIAAKATGNYIRNQDAATRVRLAAKHMGMDPQHLDLTCSAIADKLEGKTGEEILEIFETKGDFSPGEEREFCKVIQQALE